MLSSLAFTYIWVTLIVLGAIVWVIALVWQYFKQLATGNMPEWLASILFIPIYITCFVVFFGILSTPFTIPTLVDHLHYEPLLYPGMTRDELRAALDVEHRTKPGPPTRLTEYFSLSGTVCLVNYDSAGRLKTYQIYFD